ncbi:MAG: LUD domain-containing protein [Anaerolineae bacterium]|jgi:L-lactate dehydrogenase complex protein LldF|nr:LUD domain-containing protein [Anaerolineae bacterium]MBT4309806.1 LUD domain-containing protein [Anaerolineae bacterium]MBT4457061.1 LUD domain-containing protein [Anaerolineae bacterium]MBT4843205.1 LUD domain-containing protein [Anaerolineae bacterium]MBT6063141.1 LUD domain-containing protein [Anaerolineae bacterium]
MKSFHQRIRKSIADKNLQSALDTNAQRRVEGSVAAFASIPDHQERRQRAYQIRQNVIENLDDISSEFLAKSKENRIVVHRAKNAKEAVEIALKIVADSPQRDTKKKTKSKTSRSSRLGGSKKLIAKSKSMVTEEIELNAALGKAGHKVVETDLGEYIVQLRHEKPSHIITPAVHLRREDVAQLFHEELGIPYTKDIPTLTEVARQKLRKIFLDADIGISGINFGVAESGSLCIITNEGNGRMVTTLPRTHIAVMGMERLLSNMDDLALMLSLLPRSATTQKITVYTQFIQKPLPGQERHLIFLDNGRSNLRQTPINDSLLCIRCGACLNACPIFREIGGHAYDSVYPGPIGSVISAGLFGAEHVPLAQACSVCGACKEACPVDIDLPKMLLRVRSGQWIEDSGRSGEGLPLSVKLGLKAYRRVALAPNLFALSQRGMGNLASTLKRDYLHLPAWTGWGYGKDFPCPAEKSFREIFEARETKVAKATRVAKEKTDAPTIPRFPTPDSLIILFTKEATALSAKIIPVSTAELPKKLTAYLRQHQITRVQAEADIGEYISDEKIAHQRQANPNITVGITRAIAAVAETGSILITGENRDALCASLLPEIHIAILQSADILQTLEEVLALPVIVKTPAASLISGPSRTADIEMTLTIGVHGPKELIVFLVDD